MRTEEFGLRGSSTSYLSAPEAELDPSLFEGTHMLPQVRNFLLGAVTEFLRESYLGPENWSRVWISGSGVSYQWSAARDPADLDVMLGIDYVGFRHANPHYQGYSDNEISSMLNEDMREDLGPDISQTSFGRSNFDVTIYVNKGVGAGLDDILLINPYAAYDLTADEWAVPPNPNPMVRVHPSWDVTVEQDRQRATQILRMYDQTLDQIENAQNPAHRVNAERQFQAVLESASSLYDEIHSGRHAAFSIMGAGYADFTNYRWQHGKSTGVIQAMRNIKDYQTAQRESGELDTYGLNLPDSQTLVRRAMTYKAPYS